MAKDELMRGVLWKHETIIQTILWTTISCRNWPVIKFLHLKQPIYNFYIG